MARNKVTLQQIADELGTSKVTVSRAINGKPGIGDNLRRRILERASAYGYLLPNNEDITIKTLAFLIPRRFFLEMDHFYTVIYLHLNRLCQAKHIVLSAITISQEEEREGCLPSLLLHQKYDGVFVAGECHSAIIEKVREISRAVIMIDSKSNEHGLSCVLSDNYTLGYEVAEYLLNKGHREIGFVGDYYNNPNICDRYMGLRKALVMRKIPYDTSYDLVNNDYYTGLYTLNFQLPAKLPTAYVCFCDMAAHYLYEKLHTAGLRVPEDVSIISFDNTEICENMTPPLTSMEINKEDFAHLAFEQMMKEAVSSLGAPKYLFVRSCLIERGSVREN